MNSTSQSILWLIQCTPEHTEVQNFATVKLEAEERGVLSLGVHSSAENPSLLLADLR